MNEYDSDGNVVGDEEVVESKRVHFVCHECGEEYDVELDARTPAHQRKVWCDTCSKMREVTIN